jgi:phosphohistidine phosphatase
MKKFVIVFSGCGVYDGAEIQESGTDMPDVSDAAPTKTLHIVRHGKALQDYHSIRDYDRPLIEKGIVNSENAAKQLYAQYPAPDLIISSHAVRALHTAHIFFFLLGYPHNRVQVNEKLYMEGEKKILDVIKNLPHEIRSVMIVGHNPDLSYLAYTCAGGQYTDIPTSGVVTVRYETKSWIQTGSMKNCEIAIHY